MSLSVVLDQFFDELPSLIDQARRHAYSNNLNILEYYNRRLHDALNLLIIFTNRCEDVNSPDSLLHEIRQLTREVQALCGRLENVIATDEDYALGLADSRVDEIQTENANETYGRPRLLVDKVEIERLFDIYHSWREVAAMLGVSTRTLQRRRTELGLELSRRRGPRITYTPISDEELCNTVREVLEILPNAGETYIIGACRRRNIHVQRQRIRNAIAMVDPVSRALRRSISVIRRTYSVPAPNSLW